MISMIFFLWLLGHVLQFLLRTFAQDWLLPVFAQDWFLSIVSNSGENLTKLNTNNFFRKSVVRKTELNYIREHEAIVTGQWEKTGLARGKTFLLINTWRGENSWRKGKVTGFANFFRKHILNINLFIRETNQQHGFNTSLTK